jgi:hypothetical protein
VRTTSLIKVTSNINKPMCACIRLAFLAPPPGPPRRGAPDPGPMILEQRSTGDTNEIDREGGHSGGLPGSLLRIGV